MVQRVSNPLGFEVLTSAPTLATGIRAEVLDGSTGAVLAILGDSFDRSWTDELNGAGAGSVSVMADHPALLANPQLLQSGNLVRFKLDGVARFTFVIEARRRSVVGEGEDAARAITAAGRGALALLNDAAVYPAGGIAGDPDRIYTTNAGAMLDELLLEAQARGVAQLVSWTFTPAADSLGAPWAVPVNLTHKAGKTDLLRVATQTAEVAADVNMTPGLVLDVRNTFGVDRTLQTVDTGPLELRPGVDVVQLDADEDAHVTNVLLIDTPAGLVERIDAASVSTFRRREAVLSLGNVTDPAQITRTAGAVFARTGSPAGRTAFRIVEGAASAGRVPYRDFGKGDWLRAPDAAGVLQRQRVRAITVTDGAEGRPAFVVELAALSYELEDNLARWLASMTRGGLSGVAADVVEPNDVTPTEVTVTATAEADAAIAAHVGLFLHPDELADLADVDLAGAGIGDVLSLTAGAPPTWQPATRDGLLTADNLADVDTTTTPPTVGAALVWDGAAWTPAHATPAGFQVADDAAGAITLTSSPAVLAGLWAAPTVTDPAFAFSDVSGVLTVNDAGLLEIAANLALYVASGAATGPYRVTLELERDAGGGFAALTAVQNAGPTNTTDDRFGAVALPAFLVTVAAGDELRLRASRETGPGATVQTPQPAAGRTRITAKLWRS